LGYLARLSRLLGINIQFDNFLPSPSFFKIVPVSKELSLLLLQAAAFFSDLGQNLNYNN